MELSVITEHTSVTPEDNFEIIPIPYLNENYYTNYY